MMQTSMSANDPKPTLNAHCAQCDAHAMFPSVVWNPGIAMHLNYPPLLLMALLAIASAQAFGQEKDLTSAEYSKCIEQSGGTDPGITAWELKRSARTKDLTTFTRSS